jgi:hypothetical protein
MHDDYDREKVVVAARAKAKELGLGRSAVAFDVEVLLPYSDGKCGGNYYVLDTADYAPLNGYVAVSRHRSGYVIAAGDTPDMREGSYSTKKEAMDAARALQEKRGRHPDLVLDLTNAYDKALGEFLR